MGKKITIVYYSGPEPSGFLVVMINSNRERFSSVKKLITHIQELRREGNTIILSFLLKQICGFDEIVLGPLKAESSLEKT